MSRDVSPSLQVTSILGRQLQGLRSCQKFSNPEMSNHFCCKHIVDLLQPWRSGRSMLFVVYNISSSILCNGLNQAGGEENGKNEKNGTKAKQPLRFAQEPLSLRLLLGAILPKLLGYALRLMCCYCCTSKVSPLISLCFNIRDMNISVHISVFRILHI